MSLVMESSSLNAFPKGHTTGCDGLVLLLFDPTRGLVGIRILVFKSHSSNVILYFKRVPKLPRCLFLIKVSSSLWGK